MKYLEGMTPTQHKSEAFKMKIKDAFATSSTDRSEGKTKYWKTRRETLIVPQMHKEPTKTVKKMCQN
jgi:hypothetical protein